MAIRSYPLKAGRGIALDESLVEPWGLAGDRRWVLIDAETDRGTVLAQADVPGLTQVCVGPLPTGGLAVRAPGMPPLTIEEPVAASPAERVRVDAWGCVSQMTAADGAASEWFSAYTGRRVRLVHQDDPARRPLSLGGGGPAERVSFTMDAPVQVTTVASLAAVNTALAAKGKVPVPMDRFRPNVVVDGTVAWEEDAWTAVRIGDVRFRVQGPCVRCVIVSIDQETGRRGREPLTVLGRIRRFGNQLRFGTLLVPEGTGTIRVGDPFAPDPTRA